MKKKILALTLSLVMAVGFSACGNQSVDSQGGRTSGVFRHTV